ncbi:hypothetical protein BG006_002429 [Podila minutissima]|uniref:Smr domain-containing protein n=1 Tax=Podila minutissima TaxID=64525 RepID=A0A9P5VNP2_9FUNG|nr:hypothetical protein BG006_002429 [Podila minutissima]
MFCPRLDSALVASIFNDVGDFKEAIPILSALAADTVPMSQLLPSTPLRPISASATNIAKTTSNDSNNKTAKTANKISSSNKTTPSSNKTTPSSGSSTTNQQNILIWSSEVANSNAGSGAATEPRTIGAYPTASNTIASTSTSSAPPKQAFRAIRNPKYMQKHNIAPEPIPPEPNDDDNDIDNELAQDDNTYDEAPQPQAVETKQDFNNTSKKKGSRKKSQNNTNLSSTTPTTPRRLWKKDQEGKHSLAQQDFENTFATLTLSKDTAIPEDASDHEKDQEQRQQSQPQAQQQQQQDATPRSPQNYATAQNGPKAKGPKAEEIEFLKSCFPDREHSDEYLTQVLKDSQRDLEVAVDMILSQMFLENEQIETSSSGSGSLHSTSSHTTATSTSTTSSLDDAFYQGVDKGSKKKSKNTTAWGTPAYNPAANIFGDSHNDPLMKAITNQDEFLIPESNEWATFEHQVGILMNIFSTVPRKVIVSEYHSNGTNLFRTVESIEARLSRENYAGSAEGRHRQTEFDVQLAQLMEMFPNHTSVGLKKVLIYNGNNFHDAMNAVLAADFAQAETLTTQPKKYAHVIPLQADVRFSNKSTAIPSTGGASSCLRSLPSTHNPFPNGTRMFPNTILDASNADLYNDEDDPLWCRQRAHETLDQRNELFRKAARAYKDAKNKGVGMGGIAAFYADEGKKLDAQGKQWHMRAARAVVQQHRLENNDPNLVDLHGLTIAEAQTVVKEAVTQWFSRATMQASRIAAKPLKIICGVGSHSKDRVARLYPTILNLLMKDGWRIEADQGVILVKGVSRIMPSTSKR